MGLVKNKKDFYQSCLVQQDGHALGSHQLKDPSLQDPDGELFIVALALWNILSGEDGPDPTCLLAGPKVLLLCSVLNVILCLTTYFNFYNCSYNCILILFTVQGDQKAAMCSMIMVSQFFSIQLIAFKARK